MTFVLFYKCVMWSAFIVLFLDMRNAVSSYFPTVSLCTVQVSVQVFANKITKLEGYSLCVTSVCNHWDVLIFA